MLSLKNKTFHLLPSLLLGASVFADSALVNADVVAVAVREVNDLAQLASASDNKILSVNGVLESWPATSAYPSRSYKDGDSFQEYYAYQFTPSLSDNEGSGIWLLYSKEALEPGNKAVTGKLLDNTAKPGTMGSGLVLFKADSVVDN